MNGCKVEPGLEGVVAGCDGGAATRAPGGDAPRVLVLGLGNDILTDDAAGIWVARRLQELLGAESGIVVQETAEMGLALLDLVEGFEGLVLVDAVVTGTAVPGTLHEFDAARLDAVPGMAPHGLGVGEVLAAGRQLGLKIPEVIRVFGVEAADPFSLGSEPTRAVREALPALCDCVLEAAESLVIQLRG